jgi:hypothetical protein
MDAGVAILGKLNFDYYRISLFPRMVFEAFAIGYLISNIQKRMAKQAIIVVLMLIIASFVGYGVFFPLNCTVNIIETIIAFNKYIYFLIVFPVLFTIYEKSEKGRQLLYKVYEVIIYLNCIAIVIGALYKIDLFSSYGSYRFGYKGLIYAVNEASVFCVIALLYSLYVLHNKKRISLLLTVVAASFLLGTKSGYLFTILILAAYLLMQQKNAIVRILTLILLLFLGISLSQINIMAFLSNYRIFDWFAFSYQKSGLWTMLLSGRDVFIQERFYPLVNQWGLENWLFGGTNIAKNAIEMDFHDLLLFFGLVGGCIYFIAYFIMMLSKHNVKYSLFVIILYFMIAALAGHFFYSAVNAVYLSILLIRIKDRNDINLCVQRS